MKASVFVFQLMKSKFVLGLAMASLLVAIFIGLFWVRSYRYYDAVYYANLQRYHELFTVPGSIVFSTWNQLPADSFLYDGASGAIGQVPMRLYRDGQITTALGWDNPPSMHAGFWWDRGTVPIKRGEETVLEQTHLSAAFPFWVPILVFLLAPITWLLKLRQRYIRAKTGHCIYCNAEMPTPDRCPNCETEFESWVL